MIQVGVIGLGRWGRALCRAVRAHSAFKLVAVCDKEPKQMRRQDDVWRYSAPLDVLERPEVAAVLIATPIESHANLTITALEHGKHVWCEPPVTMSQIAVNRIRQRLLATDRFVLVNCIPVYLDDIYHLQHSISDKRPNFVNMVRVGKTPPGIINPLWDLATHDLGILYYWFGKLPYVWELIEVNRGPVYQWRGTYENGVQVNYVFGYAGEKKRYIEVAFADMCVRTDQDQTKPEPLQSALTHFAECIEFGTKPRSGLAMAEEVGKTINSWHKWLHKQGVKQAI